MEKMDISKNPDFKTR